MADKKKEEKPLTYEDTLKNLQPLSKLLKSSVGSIWKIFVVRYRAKGAGELVAAIIIAAISIRLLGTTSLWLFAPAVPVVILLFDAIQLLVAPHYFAMGDVAEQIKKYNKAAGTQMTIYNK